MKKSFAILTVLLLSVPSARATTCTTANSIVKVKNLKLGSQERVEFYIKTPFTGSVVVAAASSGTFIQDGSGNPIVVVGNRWTDVKFKSMYWTCSSLTLFSLPKPILKDIQLIGQFEGQIEYAIGRHNGHYLSQTSSTSGGVKKITLKYGP